MDKDEFIKVVKLLGMTTPKVATFLKVAQNTVNQWRAKSGPNPSGPAEVALRLECEKRGVEWPIEEK